MKPAAAPFTPQDYEARILFSESGQAQGYEIVDRAGKVVCGGHGFIDEDYLREAIDIALRRMRGAPPQPVDYAENLKPATVAIVKSWVSLWYPNPKKTA